MVEKGLFFRDWNNDFGSNICDHERIQTNWIAAQDLQTYKFNQRIKTRHKYIATLF